MTLIRKKGMPITKKPFVRNFRELREKVERIIFPCHLTCLFCGAELFDFYRYNICKDCLGLLEMNTFFCEVCGRAVPEQRTRCGECIVPENKYTVARSAVCYSGFSKHMVHELKFGDAVAMSKPMATLCFDSYVSNGFNCDIVTFVPMTKKSLRKERSYNQSELIARELAKMLNLPLHSLLKKVKETKGQGQVEYSKRKENIQNAFEVADRENVRDKNVLLVDDIYTSGATSNECAKKLASAGAKAVYVLTFASVKTYDENIISNAL